MWDGLGEFENQIYASASEGDQVPCVVRYKDYQRTGDYGAMGRILAWWIWCHQQNNTPFEKWRWALGESQLWLRKNYDPRILNAISRWVHLLSGIIHQTGAPKPYQEYSFPYVRDRGNVVQLDDDNFWEYVEAGRSLWSQFGGHTSYPNDLMAVHANVFVLQANGRMLPGINFPTPRVVE